MARRRGFELRAWVRGLETWVGLLAGPRRGDPERIARLELQLWGSIQTRDLDPDAIRRALRRVDARQLSEGWRKVHEYVRHQGAGGEYWDAERELLREDGRVNHYFDDATDHRTSRRKLRPELERRAIQAQLSRPDPGVDASEGLDELATARVKANDRLSPRRARALVRDAGTTRDRVLRTTVGADQWHRDVAEPWLREAAAGARDDARARATKESPTTGRRPWRRARGRTRAHPPSSTGELAVARRAHGLARTDLRGSLTAAAIPTSLGAAAIAAPGGWGVIPALAVYFGTPLAVLTARELYRDITSLRFTAHAVEQLRNVPREAEVVANRLRGNDARRVASAVTVADLEQRQFGEWRSWQDLDHRTLSGVIARWAGWSDLDTATRDAVLARWTQVRTWEHPSYGHAIREADQQIARFGSWRDYAAHDHATITAVLTHSQAWRGLDAAAKRPVERHLTALRENRLRQLEHEVQDRRDSKTRSTGDRRRSSAPDR